MCIFSFFGDCCDQFYYSFNIHYRQWQIIFNQKTLTIRTLTTSLGGSKLLPTNAFSNCCSDSHLTFSASVRQNSKDSLASWSTTISKCFPVCYCFNCQLTSTIMQVRRSVTVSLFETTAAITPNDLEKLGQRVL